MNPTAAGQIITEYMKPVYGFALKRCACIQDAEDLAQEICLRLYRALLAHDAPDSVPSFVWTVAHNALANYYRRGARGGICVPVDALAQTLAAADDPAEEAVRTQTVASMQSEIAFLSATQRRIVIAYYYENKKQDEIARELGIPAGTVKWHLFEAKKELKRGMETMRTPGELKFNPIKFAMCGISGSVGTKGGGDSFFRSALAQNIAYDVRLEAKTINEIAQDLGVSPVYVENEAAYLAEYGFLAERGGKYLINFLLDEPTKELLTITDAMYRRAAELVAPELFDKLNALDLSEYGVRCGDTAGVPLTLASDTPADRNYLLWSLVPYIAALSGEELMDSAISFEEAMTIRPDGGQNICYASVVGEDVKYPDGYTIMRDWFGPCWNAHGKYTLWSVDSEWSDKRKDFNYSNEANRALPLLARFEDGAELSGEEYAYLAEKGYISTVGDPGSMFKAAGRYVYIDGAENRRRLLELGGEVKAAHKAELDAVKAPYVRAVLDATPAHLQKMKRYGLQFVFFSDGWFLLHCLKFLVDSGKLKLPTAEQKKSLTTLLLAD